jgi:hypothetical protein
MSTDSAEVMHPLHARQSVSDISARWSGWGFCPCGSRDDDASSFVVFVVEVEAPEVGGCEEVETS